MSNIRIRYAVRRLLAAGGLVAVMIGSSAVWALNATNEWEYLVRPDHKQRWKIEMIFPWAVNNMRIDTEPALSPSMNYKRAVVIKQGAIAGFIRILQAYPPGATVAPLADTLDIDELRHGDIVCDFTLERVSPPDLATMEGREKDRLRSAILNLGSPGFNTRREATTFLKRQGRIILPLLADAINHEDPEVRLRAADIVKTIRSREFAVSPAMAQILQRQSGRGKPREKQGFLGIGIANVRMPETSGTLVTQVIPESPAAAAGLKLRDVITAIGKQKLYDSTDLLEIISAKEPGTTVPLTFLRDGKTFTTNAVLTHRPLPLP